MFNVPLYRNGVPREYISVDRIQTAVDIRVNGHKETFNPEDAVEYLMDECGLTLSEASRLIGD